MPFNEVGAWEDFVKNRTIARFLMDPVCKGGRIATNQDERNKIHIGQDGKLLREWICTKQHRPKRSQVQLFGFYWLTRLGYVNPQVKVYPG